MVDTSILRGIYDYIRELNYSHEFISRSYIVEGAEIHSYELLNVHKFDIENLLSRLDEDVTDGEVIYDVGANIGTHSLVLATKYDVLINSFEPNPTVYRWLIANIFANNFDTQIQTHKFGLSNQNRVLEMYPAHRRSTFEDHKPRNAGPPVEVPVRRLDTLVNDGLTPPDRIKIDVEGHEATVIEGMLSTLRTHEPTIYVEPHSNTEDIIQILADIGYNIEQKPLCIIAFKS